MSFPATPRDITAEMFLGNTWTDVSSHVYQRQAIQISRGRRNETSSTPPASCTLTLDNRSGNYSPRNPLGAYFGNLGRNTPLRLGLRMDRDTFTRTSVSSWGSTNNGYVWSNFGDGTSSAAQFNVASGVGTHSVSAANAYRASYLAGMSYTDMDVAVTVTIPFTDVTGAAIQPANILVRSFLARVIITTAEAVQIELVDPSGVTMATAVTVAGLTHSTAQALRVRAQLEGQTFRAKVWAASGSEPYGWHITGNITATTDGTVSPGGAGIRSGVATGNTNAKPIVFSYDNWVVTVPRFAGEIGSFTGQRDTSGNDRTMAIEAAGIRRRLGQGEAPQKSAYRRAIDAASGVVAYWPCEDESTATMLASGLASGTPLTSTPGPPNFATNSDFDCSSALPTFDNTWWYSTVPDYTWSGGQFQARFLLSVPSAGGYDGEKLMRVAFYRGSTGIWDLVYGVGGTLTLLIYDRDGVLLYTSGAVASTLDGRPVRVSLELTQSGSNINWNVSHVAPGVGVTGGFNGTLNSNTFRQAEWINLGGDGFHTSVAVGHVTVQNVVTASLDLYTELSAHAGETAGARLLRLCGENSIPFSYYGVLTTTARMGPQKPVILSTLLDDCAEADLGSLYEPRGALGIEYRTRESLYGATATATLDFSLYQLNAPFEPEDDDRNTRNDVIAKRQDGGQYRATLSTGRMSVLDPSVGGVGRYDTTAQVNVQTDGQLPDVAGWLLALGTVDEARFPRLTVDWANRAVVSANLDSVLLALNVDDRVTVTNADAAYMFDDVNQVVRGYDEWLRPFEHTIALNTTPQSPYQVLVLDASGHKLQLAGVTLNEDLDTTETGVDIAISAGNPLLTTVVGQMPISIMVGGELMTVSAISGASSPQTMTVTRSVNAVVKTHLTGAAVLLARRSTIAL